MDEKAANEWSNPTPAETPAESGQPAAAASTKKWGRAAILGIAAACLASAGTGYAIGSVTHGNNYPSQGQFGGPGDRQFGGPNGQDPGNRGFDPDGDHQPPNGAPQAPNGQPGPNGQNGTGGQTLGGGAGSSSSDDNA